MTHAVMVAGQTADGRWVLAGSGAVLEPGRVLTARHCLSDKQGQTFQALKIKVSEVAHPVDEVLWQGPAELDVAVLSVPTLEGAAVPLQVRATQAHEQAEIAGYPKILDHPPNTSLQKLLCKLTTSAATEELQVQLDEPPDSIFGLSGAAVVARGRLVGVVRAVQKGWKARVYATPVGCFYDEPGFIQATGGQAQRDRLAALRVWLVNALTPTLLKRLGGGDAEGAADELLHDPCSQVLRRLKAAAQGAGPDAMAQLRAVALRLVPLAVDWRAHVSEAARACGVCGWVELPVYSATVAELIMAGVDNRQAVLVPQDGFVRRGASSLRSAELLAAMGVQPGGGRPAQALLDATVDHLGKQFGFTEGKTPKHLWPELVDEKLEGLLADAGPDKPPPFYLVLDEALWTDDMRDALRDEDEGLPSLRLIRLIDAKAMSRKQRKPENEVARLVDTLLSDPNED